MAEILSIPKQAPQPYSMYHLMIATTVTNHKYLEVYHRIRTPFDSCIVAEEGWDERVIQTEIDLTTHLMSYSRESMLSSLDRLMEEARRRPESVPGTISYTTILAGSAGTRDVTVNPGRLSIHTIQTDPVEWARDFDSLFSYAQDHLPHRLSTIKPQS